MTNPPATRRRRPERLAFLLRPFWIGAILAAITFAAACWLLLAPWQFSRHAERDAQNNAIDAAQTAAPVPAATYLNTGDQPAADATWRQVTATGTFDTAAQVYVRLRQDSQDNPASEVLLPFRLDDGSTLFVDRGYVPDADVGAGQAAPPPPTGRVQVVGRVQQDQPDPLHRAPVRVHDLTAVYGIDSAALAELSGVPAGTSYLGFVQLVDGSPGVLDAIGMPQTDGGPFLSYALQWCVFGVVALLGIGYFIVREATDAADPDDAEDERDFVADGPETEPTAALTGTPVAVPAAPRRSRGFDKSQLYD